jgi:hypothetical protein
VNYVWPQAKMAGQQPSAPSLTADRPLLKAS